MRCQHALLTANMSTSAMAVETSRLEGNRGQESYGADDFKQLAVSRRGVAKFRKRGSWRNTNI